jgi:glyoxylase-like metal-dependent hydrolase (beta-lactamase superfamily II)
MSISSLKRISDKIVYLPADHETDRPILAAITGTHRTLLVDSGNSSAHAEVFLNALSQQLLSPISFVVLTHWHWDHIFGVHRMGFPTIAHKHTRLRMEEMVDWSWSDEALDQRVAEGIEIPFCAEMIKKEFSDRNQIVIALPDIVYEKCLEVDLGGLTCVIEHVPCDHSEDNTFVFIKEERVLFVGDSLGANFYAPERYYTAEKLLTLLEKIESYDARIIVASHWEAVDKEEFQTEIDELRAFAHTAEAYGQDREAFLQQLQEKLGRTLNDADCQYVDYFLNGIEKNK